MKRSNDYGPHPPMDNYKKQRFSPQSAYGYPISGSPPNGYSQSNADLYPPFGGMAQYMSMLNGMGGMAGLGNHQPQQNGNGGPSPYQGMSPNQYQVGPQYSQGGYTAPYTPATFHGTQYASNQHAAFNQTMRTIYLGNLPALVSYEEVINVVRGGTLEQVKILEEKNCAFVTFVEAGAAQAFHAECQTKRLLLNNQELKVGWGKHSSIPPAILAAIQSGASRNVFIGNIDEMVTEPMLIQEFGRFGPIDQVKILPEKRIAFVHMASIAAAMKAVASLPNDPRWANRRVNYGKDRCAYQPKSSGSARSSPPNTPGGMVYSGGMSYSPPAMVGYGLPYGDPYNGMGSMNGNAGTNRTVYLGSIHPDVTTKDLCDVIRGGILQNIKYMPDKNIAFVTFIDPAAALNFYNRGTYEGVVLKGKRLKIGWGKPTALPPSIAAAAQSGASRNVYIGSIDDTVDEDSLRRDFAEFGDIELVNIIPDKNIGFVNFVDLTSAVKAVETMRGDESRGYGRYRINFGKDRCGNPPRPPRESAAQRAQAAAAAAAEGPFMVHGGMVQGVVEGGLVGLGGMDETESLLGGGLLGGSGSFL